MKRSKRIEALDRRPVNLDGYIDEWPEMGFVAMSSPYDPKPSVRVEGGKIVELDGKQRDDFDFLDQFIADYAINVERAETSMAVSSLDIARMIVDINVSRKEILELISGITPAKMTEVMNQLNVVELMMGMQKIRARRTPGNQAHITNLKDDPVQIAADAAEGALRGFAEEETTMGVARYAPLSAMALLIGSQVGRPGVLTQCSAEEATELELGIRGLTTYAETLSVYGTEKVFIDGDDTPYSKAFLNSAYASRGLKVRFTSGSGSEVLMGSSEKKSMLYLECRCLFKLYRSDRIRPCRYPGSPGRKPCGSAPRTGVRFLQRPEFLQLGYETYRQDHAGIPSGNRFHLFRIRGRAKLRQYVCRLQLRRGGFRRLQCPAERHAGRRRIEARH